MSEVSRFEISLENSEHTLCLAMPIGVATAELCDLDYEQSDGDKSERTDLVFPRMVLSFCLILVNCREFFCIGPLIAIIFLLLAAS